MLVTKDWRKLLSFIAEGLILFNERGLITLLNPHATLLLDIRAVEVIGKSVDKIFEFYIDNKLVSTSKRFTYYLFKLETPFHIPIGSTAYFKSASGRKFPVFAAAREVKLGKRNKKGGVLVFRDITTEKKLENYKTDTIKRLAILNPILQKTATGDLSSEIKIPKKEDEFTGLLVGLKLTIDDLKELEILREKNEKEKIINVRKAEEDKRILTEQYSKELEVKVADQTKEIRRAYEVEKKARVELEQLDKNKDQFILATQHHLRTPLTIIKGYVQFLLTTPPQEFKEETKTMLEKVNTGADRLSTLVNDLLDISQMQVGKDILKKEEIDLKPMIEEIFTDMGSELEKKKITKNIDIQEAKLQLDKVRMREAFTNLIDNAVKYCNEGGTITVKGTKIIHPIKKKEIYKLSIEDTGIGITEEELSHIFAQYFERGEEAEKLNRVGRGIGLVVTKNIIKAHGGRIYAESQGRGKGARFVVELTV